MTSSFVGSTAILLTEWIRMITSPMAVDKNTLAEGSCLKKKFLVKLL